MHSGLEVDQWPSHLVPIAAVPSNLSNGGSSNSGSGPLPLAQHPQVVQHLTTPPAFVLDLKQLLQFSVLLIFPAPTIRVIPPQQPNQQSSRQGGVSAGGNGALQESMYGYPPSQGGGPSDHALDSQPPSIAVDGVDTVPAVMQNIPNPTMSGGPYNQNSPQRPLSNNSFGGGATPMVPSLGATPAPQSLLANSPQQQQQQNKSGALRYKIAADPIAALTLVGATLRVDEHEAPAKHTSSELAADNDSPSKAAKGGSVAAELRIPNHPSVYILHLPAPQMLSANGALHSAAAIDSFHSRMSSLKQYITVANRLVNARPVQPVLLRMRMDFANGGAAGGLNAGGASMEGGLSQAMLDRELNTIRASFAPTSNTAAGTGSSTPPPQRSGDTASLERCHKAEREARRRFAAERRRLNRQNCQGLASVTISLSTHTRKSKRRPAIRVSGEGANRSSFASPRRGSSKGAFEANKGQPRPPTSPAPNKSKKVVVGSGKVGRGSIGVEELQRTFEPDEEEDGEMSLDDIQSSSEDEERRASLGGAGASAKAGQQPPLTRKEKRLAAKQAVKDRERMLLESGEALDLNRGTVSVTSPFEAGQKKTGCSVALGFTVASSSQLNLSFEMDHSTLGRLVTYRKYRPLLAMPETFLPNQRRGSTPIGSNVPPAPTAANQSSALNSTPTAPALPSGKHQGSANRNPSETSRDSQKTLAAEARFLYEDVAKEEWWARLAPYNTITIAELLARHKSRQSAAIIELVSSTSLPMQLQLAENYRFGPNHRLPDPPAVRGRIELWVEPLPTAFELFHFSAVGLVRKAGQVGVSTYADPILRLQLKSQASSSNAAPLPPQRSPSVVSTSIAAMAKSTASSTGSPTSVAPSGGGAAVSQYPPSAIDNSSSLYLSEGYRNAHAATFLPIPIAHAPSAMLDEREHYIDLSTAATSLIERLLSVAPSNLLGLGALPMATADDTTSFRAGSLLEDGARPRARMLSSGGGRGVKPLSGFGARAEGSATRLVMCSTVLPASVLPPVPVLRMADDKNEGSARPNSGLTASQRNLQRQRLSTIGGSPMSPSHRPSPPSPTRRSQSATLPTSSASSSMADIIDRKTRNMPRSSLLASTVTMSQSMGAGQGQLSSSGNGAPQRRSNSAPTMAPPGTFGSPLPAATAVPILTCTVPMRTSMLNIQVVDGIRHCALQQAASVVEATRGANPPSPTNPSQPTPVAPSTSPSKAGARSASPTAMRSASPNSLGSSVLPSGASTAVPTRSTATPTSFRDDGNVCPIMLGSTEISASDLASRTQMAYERACSYGAPAAAPASSSAPLASLLMLTSGPSDIQGEEMAPLSNNEATMPPSVALSAPSAASTSPVTTPAITTSVGVVVAPLKRNYAYDGQLISEFDQLKQRREVYPEVGSDCYPDFPPSSQRKLLASKALVTSYITEGRVLSSKLGAGAGARGADGSSGASGIVGEGTVESRRQASMAIAQQQQTLVPLPQSGASTVGSNSPRGSAPARTRGKGFSTFTAMAKKKNPNLNPNTVEGPQGILLANGDGDKAAQNSLVPASYRVPPSVTVMHLQHQRILRGLPVPCSRHNFSLLEFLRSPKNGIEFHAVTAIDYGTKLYYKRRVRRYLDLSCFPSVNNTKDLEDIVDPLPFIDYDLSFCRVSKRTQMLHSEAPPVDLSAGNTASSNTVPTPTFPNGWSAMDGIMAVVQQMLEPIAFRNARSHNDKTARTANGTSDAHNSSPFGPSRVVHRWREGKKIAVTKPPMPPGDLIAFYHETHLTQECEDEGDEIADQDGEGLAMPSLDSGSKGRGRGGMYGDNASTYSGLNNAEGSEPVIRRLYVASTKGTTKAAIFPLSVESDLNSIVLPPNADTLAGGQELSTSRGALLYQALSGKFGASRLTAPPPPPGKFVKASIPPTDMVDQSQLPTSLEKFNKKWFADAKGHYKGAPLTDTVAAKAQMYGTGRTWLRKGTAKANAVESVMAEKEKALLMSEPEILEAYCTRPKETISAAALTSAVVAGGPNSDVGRRASRMPNLADIFSVGKSPTKKDEKRRNYYSDEGEGNGTDDEAAGPVEVIYDEDYSYPYRYRLALPAAKEQIRREEERAFLESMGRPHSQDHSRDEPNAMSISSRPGSASRGVAGISNSSNLGATPMHLMIQHMLELPLGITSPLQLRLTETAEELVGDLKAKYEGKEAQRQHHARTQYRRALLLQPPSPIIDVLVGIVERCTAKQLAREELFTKELAARAEVDEDNDEEEWSEDEAEVATAEAQRRRQKDSTTSAQQSAVGSPSLAHLAQEGSPVDVPAITKPPTISKSYFDHMPSSELIMNPREQRRAFQHEARPGRHPSNRLAKSQVRHDCRPPMLHHVATVVVNHPMLRSNRSHTSDTDGPNERTSCDLESVLAYLGSVAHLPIYFIFIFVNCEAPIELMSFPNVLTSDFYTLAAEMLREIPQSDRNGQFFDTVVVKPDSDAPAHHAVSPSPTPVVLPASQRPSQVADPSNIGLQTRPPSSGNVSRSGQRVTFQSGEAAAESPQQQPDQEIPNLQSSKTQLQLTVDDAAWHERQRNNLLTLHASMRSLHRTFDNISAVSVNYCRVRYQDDQLPYDAIDGLFDPNELMEGAEMLQDEQYEAARQREMELQMAAAVEAVAESARRVRGAGGEGNSSGGEGSYSNQNIGPMHDGDPSVELMATTSAIDGSRTSADGRARNALQYRRGTSLAEDQSAAEANDEEDQNAENDGTQPAHFDEAQIPLDERQCLPDYPSGASCFTQIDTWRYNNGDPSANRREYLKASATFHEAMADGGHEEQHGYYPRPPFPSTIVPPTLRPDNTQGSGSEQQRRLMILQSLTPRALKRSMTPPLASGGHVQGQALMSKYLSDDDEEGEGGRSGSSGQGSRSNTPLGRRRGVQKATLTVLDVFMDQSELQKHQKHATHVSQVLTGGGSGGAGTGKDAKGRLRQSTNVSAGGRGAGRGNGSAATSPLRGRRESVAKGSHSGRELSPTAQATSNQMKELMLLEETALRRKLQQLQQRDDVWVALDSPQRPLGAGDSPQKVPPPPHTMGQHPRTVVTVKIDPKFRDLVLDDDDELSDAPIGTLSSGTKGGGAKSGGTPLDKGISARGALGAGKGGQASSAKQSSTVTGKAGGSSPQQIHDKGDGVPVSSATKGGTVSVIGGKYSHDDRFTVYKVQVDGAPMSSSLFTTNNRLSDIQKASNRYAQLARTPTMASAAGVHSPRRALDGAGPQHKEPTRPTTSGAKQVSPRKPSTAGNALLGASTSKRASRPSSSPKTRSGSGERRPSSARSSLARRGSSRSGGKSKKHTMDEMLYTTDGSVSLQGLPPAKAKQLRAMLRSENAVYGGPKLDLRQVRAQEDQLDLLAATRVSGTSPGVRLVSPQDQQQLQQQQQQPLPSIYRHSGGH